MNATTGRNFPPSLDPFAEILAQAESITPYPTLTGRRRPAVPAFDDILSQAPDFNGTEQPSRAVTLAPARMHRGRSHNTTATANSARPTASRPATVRPERVVDQRPLPPVKKIDPVRKAILPDNLQEQAAPLSAAQEELIRALDEFDYDD